MMLHSILVLGGLALVLGGILAIAYTKLAVHSDPREEAIIALLPGANCGTCGFPGCAAYAAKLAQGEAEPNLCPVIEPDMAQALAKTLGIEIEAREPRIAVLICQGGKDICPERYIYEGLTDCRSACLLHGGNKACPFGCIGLGDCERGCPFGAIRMGPDRLPRIDPDKCTGCGICVRECPKQTLILIPRSKLVYLACISQDKGKEVSSVCRLGCIGCTLCVRACPFDALKMEGNLPVMEIEHCTDCGICVHKCPTHSFIDQAAARPYALISDRCNGCGECQKVCQFKAIEGEGKEQRRVIQERCIGCRECERVCPVDAVEMVGAEVKVA